MAGLVNVIEDDFSLTIDTNFYIYNSPQTSMVMTPERPRESESLRIYPNSPITTRGYRVVTPERPRKNNTDLSRNNVPRMFPNISVTSGMVTPERPIVTDLARDFMPSIVRRSPRVVTPERRRLF